MALSHERERPHEWLRELKERASGYEDLVRESGDPVVAAHRLASARCRSSAHATAVPTLREVQAAASQLYEAFGARFDRGRFSATRVRDDCEKAGLLVIAPPAPRLLA
jgi:hypothetical protein